MVIFNSEGRFCPTTRNPSSVTHPSAHHEEKENVLPSFVASMNCPSSRTHDVKRKPKDGTARILLRASETDRFCHKKIEDPERNCGTVHIDKSHTKGVCIQYPGLVLTAHSSSCSSQGAEGPRTPNRPIFSAENHTLHCHHQRTKQAHTP